MRKNTIKCDRCGAEETFEVNKTPALKLMVVGAAIRDPDRYYYGSTMPTSEVIQQQEWCVKCCGEIGLKDVFEKGKKVEPAKTLTTEEQLLEVLRVFVQENSPQQQ